MNFNEYTLTVLKNFSSINPSVVLKPGKIQKTINYDSTILVQAEIDDTLPVEFGIYDLNQFLGNITTLKDPNLEFNDKNVVMSDANLNLNFYSASPSLIKTPPDKELNMTKVDAKFALSNSIMQKLLRLASMNQLPHMSFVGKNGELNIVVHDIGNDTSNSVTTKIDDYAGDDFAAPFQIESFKLISDDYEVELMIKGFAKLTSKTRNLKYFIAEMV